MPRFASPRLPRLLALFGIIVFCLTACGGVPSTSPSSSNGPVDLTYWSLNVDMQPSINLFQQKYPNIHVHMQKLPGGDAYYTKLQAAIKAGNAPDAVRIEYQELPTIETTGGLVDLSPYGANELKSKYVPWTWSQVIRGNAVYAIPEDTGPMGMYYRADLFQKYHIAVPTTWAAYADDAVKLHAADPAISITDFPPNEPGWFAGLVWQGGGRWFSTSGNAWKVSINDAASKQVAAYWQDLISKNLVKTEGDFTDAWNADLSSGSIATWMSAVWGTGFLASAAPKTVGDWRVAPLPQWTAGQNASGNWGGSTTAVTTSSKHPKEAAEFAEFLDGDAQSVGNLVKNAGLLPALQSGLADPTFSQPQTFYGSQNVYPVFSQATQHIDQNFQWGPTMTQVYADLIDQFGSAANGKTTLPAALDAVQSSTMHNMTSQGFTVQP